MLCHKATLQSAIYDNSKAVSKCCYFIITKHIHLYVLYFSIIV